MILTICIIFFQQLQENLGICRQRWFYSGKLLGNRLHISDCGIIPGYIVQCIITENFITPVDS